MHHHTIKKQTRTISGVTPVAVMTRPGKCPGNCIYCPTYSDTPQSYTPKWPAVLRAIDCDYDPFEQVKLRLNTLRNMGHPTDKVELIIMGGTFLSRPRQYQHDFTKRCFDALNGSNADTLEAAQGQNEEASCRAVGMCIETRPDYCGPEEVAWMTELGATRVEIGVQAIDDEVYRLTRRGHTVDDVVQAIRRAKNAGLKVHYHWMPNLPGVEYQNEAELFSRLFSSSDFCPDGLKLYPTMVVAGTELERWHRDGRYQPYTEQALVDLIAALKRLVPEYVRISRVLRDIPPVYITGGPRDSLRDRVQKRMEETGTSCQCIRCREYGHRIKRGYQPGEPRLARMDYPASGGNEIFLSFQDTEGTLFGLLRLRIQQERIPPFASWQAANMAVIRELHVYGPELLLGEREALSAQHKGFGRLLLAEAERICLEEYAIDRLFVLSGIGARPYYRGLGYQLDRGYMYKDLVA
jgi:elongator complex protein 3